MLMAVIDSQIGLGNIEIINNNVLPHNLSLSPPLKSNNLKSKRY